MFNRSGDLFDGPDVGAAGDFDVGGQLAGSGHGKGIGD